MGRKRGHGSVGGCVQVSLRNAKAHGRAIRIAGQDKRSSSGQDDQITVGIGRLGPVLSEWRDRNVNERGIDPGKVGETEIAFRQIAGIVRLDEKICMLDEAAQKIAAAVSFNIKRDSSFVAIVRPPIQRAVGVRRVLVERTDTACRASAWRLDFDDVGAHVAEHLAA